MIYQSICIFINSDEAGSCDEYKYYLEYSKQVMLNIYLGHYAQPFMFVLLSQATIQNTQATTGKPL